MWLPAPYILAVASTTNPAAPAPGLLVVYIIWCWRRTPSPGSTRALDGWAGFLSANLCVVGFWMKRRWALGFLWLAIWAVVIGLQRVLAASIRFETDQAASSFNMISIIGLVLMSWTTGIFALKTPRLSGLAETAASESSAAQMSPRHGDQTAKMREALRRPPDERAPEPTAASAVAVAPPRPLLPATFTFPCPHCTQHISAPRDQAGSAGGCPHCHKAVTVPAPNI
jgi:hypothetical protein